MSISTDIRNAIAARISSVDTLAVVHTYERFSTDQPELKELYTPENSDRISGWHIRQIKRAELQESNLTFRVLTTWQIMGYRSLLDSEATEIALDEILDVLYVAFRRDRFLGGLADTVTDFGAGPQLMQSGSVMFSDVLCHQVQLELVSLHFEEAEDREPVDGSETAGTCNGETWFQAAWDLQGSTTDNEQIEAEDIIELGVANTEDTEGE